MFAMRVKDIEGGNLYQIQASRDHFASHPEVDALEVWSTFKRNPYAKPPYVYTKGTTVRSLKSILTNLDVEGFPCEGGRNAIQSLAWSLFHNEGFVLFYDPDASLVRFWGPTGAKDPSDTAPRLNPNIHSSWAQTPDKSSFEIRTPSSERALHAQVVAGLLGPFKKWRRAADPHFDGNVYRAEYIHEDSAILAHHFCFWCDARDEQGHLQHAPDCEQRDCFVVQGKQQEKNTGAKARLPDHYRCTITCAFCGKRKHYEDECYHKQRLSAKLKGGDPGKGSGKGGGKGKGNDSGKGKPKGRGQGQDKGQGGRGGGANRQPDKDNKNKDKNGGNPNPNPGGNSEPSGGQSGPTTRSQTQAQQEQGAKREHEGGDDGNAKKRSRFMRMARKLRNKGFEVTCPAEF